MFVYCASRWWLQSVFFSLVYSVFHEYIGEYTFVFGWCSTIFFHPTFQKTNDKIYPTVRYNRVYRENFAHEGMDSCTSKKRGNRNTYSSVQEKQTNYIKTNEKRVKCRCKRMKLILGLGECILAGFQMKYLIRFGLISEAK